MSIFDRIPAWIYGVFISVTLYWFISGFLDSLPPVP